MSKYIMGLGDAMKDRKNFDALPQYVKNTVYDFLKNHRELKRLKVKFEKEKELYDKKVEPILNSILKTEKNIEECFKVINQIPTDFYILKGLYVEKEKKRRCYYLDIRLFENNYFEEIPKSNLKEALNKRKVLIGKTLSEIEKKIKLKNKAFSGKFNYKNYKENIPKRLRGIVNDFIIKNGVEKFYDDSYHIIWDEKGKFKYEKKKVGKGVYKNKKDRWDTTPRTTTKKPTLNRNSIRTDW